MEKNISLKNRRIVVVLLIITFLFIFLPFFIFEKEGNSVLKYAPSIISLISFLLIAYYLRLKTTAFLIATYGERELDERQFLIRLKAQRDAYDFTINLTMTVLLTGTYFFKNDINAFAFIILVIIVMMKIYLPTMIIAWREKEV